MAPPQPLGQVRAAGEEAASMEQHGITFLIAILSMLTRYL